METGSLAVQYRPKTLAEVVGQQHIVAQIKGMLKRGKMPSTFLMTGATGLGKTTLARILARYLNCANPNTESFLPCGKCASCGFEENHPDVTELNAADERGVDDVRNLVQQARNMPTIGNYRIFIVDECLPADALIELADGKFVALIDIVAEPTKYTVKTFNHAGGFVEPQPVIAGWSTGTKPGQMMEIVLDDGTKQIVSENHRWWSVTRNCYIRTDEILPNEELQSSMDE